MPKDASNPRLIPVASTVTPRSRALARLRVIGWNLLPPLTFVGIVLVWWLSVRIFKIPAYLLPGPEAIFVRLGTDYMMLWTHAKITMTEIIKTDRG